MEPTIIIDAGHGGQDNGSFYQGRLEKDDNLRLALAVGERLAQDGYTIVYTRTDDIYQLPATKASIANENLGDYFVSFHRNSSENPNTYRGVQTLIYDDNGINRELAQNVNDEMVKVGFADLFVEERDDLAVLGRTKMPAILIEAGFINSDLDNGLFDGRFDELADAIVVGIEQTVGQQAINRKKFGVQVGLFRKYENAMYLSRRLEKEGYDAKIQKRDTYYAVIVGDESGLDSSRALEKSLRELGYDTLIVNK